MRTGRNQVESGPGKRLYMLGCVFICSQNIYCPSCEFFWENFLISRSQRGGISRMLMERAHGKGVASVVWSFYCGGAGVTWGQCHPAMNDTRGDLFPGLYANKTQTQTGPDPRPTDGVSHQINGPHTHCGGERGSRLALEWCL